MILFISKSCAWDVELQLQEIFLPDKPVVQSTLLINKSSKTAIFRRSQNNLL